MAPLSRYVLATLALFALGAVSAPVPQVAGEGSACDSILTDTDSGTGYAVENAEDNTANTVSSTKGGARRRQVAGEGSACGSILTDTDSGTGYAVENAEDNTANTISSGKVSTGSQSQNGNGGGSGAPPPPPPPPGGPGKRQLNKVSNGFANLGNALGISTVSTPIANEGDNVDGELTNDAANAGAQIGGTEETTLENVGSAIPKRQLNKVSNGFANLGNAAGIGAVSGPVANEGDNVDGELTNDAANAGAQVGGTEETTLENAGSAVP